jgi:glycosyltransferase involved in cell wall biosynthesis
LVIASLEGGGAERVFVTLANGLRAEGRDVDLVLMNRAGVLLKEVKPGVNVVHLDAARAMLALVPLVKYLRRVRPEAMLTTLTHVSVVAALARKLARVPVRLVIREAVTSSVHHRYVTDVRSRVVARLLRPAYRSADVVVSPSQGVTEDLVANVGIARAHVTTIPNPLDVGRIRSLALQPVTDPFAQSDERPMVLGIGRLSAQKDFSTLILAFARTIETVPAKLLILGDGEERGALEALIRSSGLDHHVAMPGFVENPFAYLKQAAVFVLSSRYEGLPNALLQALAVGAPVVATDCPGGPGEILESGRLGRLVPVGDVEAMAVAIADGVAGRIASAPLATVEQKYGTHGIVRGYLEVLCG